MYIGGGGEGMFMHDPLKNSVKPYIYDRLQGRKSFPPPFLGPFSWCNAMVKVLYIVTKQGGIFY